MKRQSSHHVDECFNYLESVCDNMVLSSEWSEVEVIDLHNDGNGLGFILVGGRSTGVVIKALIPGGVAERDGRLQCGDHLLYIGEVNLRGFSSEQVATVLRQAGAQVRLVIARPIEPTPNDIKSKPGAIIQTKLLTDADELSRHLSQSPNLAAVINMRDEVSIKCAAESVEVDQPSTDITIPTTGVLSHISNTEPADLPLPPIPKELSDSIAQIHANNDTDIVPFSLVSPPPSVTKHSPKSTDISISSSFVGITSPMDQIDTVMADSKKAGTPSYELTSFDVMPSTYIDSPETETYEVRLRKNVYGLGITVAGYVCEEEDISGIFVKSIIEGSAAEMSGDIQINDRIVAVDGKRLSGVTNHQAVEILRNTDIEVNLTLERFLRGRKFEHLQIALTDLKSCAETQSQASLPPSPSILTLSWLPVKSDADSIATDKSALINENFDLPSRETVDSSISYILDHSSIGNEVKNVHLPNGVCADNVLENTETSLQRNSLSAASNAMSEPETTPMVNSVPVAGPMTENNNELKRTEPCPDLLKTHPFNCSEESLKVAWKSEFPESEIIVAEINKLSGLGISLEGTVDVECGIEKRPHHYIRSILEDGPVGRQGILKPGDELLQVNEHKLQGLRHTEVIKILKELPSHVKLVCVRSTMPPSVINTSQNPEAFETRSLLPGGHQTLLCLTKAQSESSLYTSSTATFTDQQRYKSLENVSGLALWDTDVTYVEIEKTDQGFGFSILDYQDPVDPDGSVIVIRGLIYGGSAEATKQIFPGDRLVSVGEHTLQGLELDEAVKILKGMPLGITKLGICRPLSTSDSNVASPNGDSDTRST